MFPPNLTILVVDDEASVRVIARRVLEGYGCVVLDAPDGQHALAFLEDSRQIDLLITDINMPDMSGIELARQVRSRRPSVKVLYLTGYVERLFEDGYVLQPNETFLEKPFSARALRDAIQLLQSNAKR
jgi:CheY-like chemotaxis protein